MHIPIVSILKFLTIFEFSNDFDQNLKFLDALSLWLLFKKFNVFVLKMTIINHRKIFIFHFSSNLFVFFKKFEKLFFQDRTYGALRANRYKIM